MTDGRDRYPQARIKQFFVLDLRFELCCCFDFGWFYVSPWRDSPVPVKKKLAETPWFVSVSGSQHRQSNIN